MKKASTSIVIIGTGTVGKAIAAAFKKMQPQLKIHILSRSQKSVDAAMAWLNKSNTSNISSHIVNALDTSSLSALLCSIHAPVVINAATPDTNLSIMTACLESQSHYIDTALFENRSDFNVPPPWYENEYALSAEFQSKGLTAILSIGFDPGAVNVFCRYAQDVFFDYIDSIDVLCANVATHTRFYSTNFNAATNLKELCEDTTFWRDRRWHSAAPFSRRGTFCFPHLGQQPLYSVAHEEVHSLAKVFPEADIEFWMRIAEPFKRTTETLYKLGLLSPNPIDIAGFDISPLEFVGKVLPTSDEFAHEYRGSVCVGTLIKGTRDGKPRKIFIHSLVHHEECYRSLGTHATAYTTAIPAMVAASLILTGEWNVGRMVHPEELPSEPFLKKIREFGLDWAVADSYQGHTFLDCEILHS